MMLNTFKKYRLVATAAFTALLIGASYFSYNLGLKINGLSRLKEGLSTCTARVTQSYTSKAMKSGGQYLNESFFSNTEDCLADVKNLMAESDIVVVHGSLKQLNSLATATYWLHKAMSSSKLSEGESFEKRFGKVENIRLVLEEVISKAEIGLSSSLTFQKFNLITLAAIIFTLLGWELSDRRKNRLVNELFELTARDYSQNGDLGDKAKRLIVEALEHNELDECSRLFSAIDSRDQRLERLRSSDDIEVVCEIEPDLNVELELESELNIELELEPEPELNIELELEPEPELNIELELEPEPELNIELELAPEPETVIEVEFEPEEATYLDASVWRDEFSAQDFNTDLIGMRETSPRPTIVESRPIFFTDVEVIFNRVADLFQQKLLNSNVLLDIRGDENVLANISVEELTQGLHSLLSDSLSRFEKQSNNRIVFFVRKLEGKAMISYMDNGPSLNPSSMNLTIAREIFKESGAQVVIENSEDFGGHVALEIDLSPIKKAEKQLVSVTKTTKRELMQSLGL